MLHAEAYAIAERIWNALRPGCERVKIAGSLRRKCTHVRDIEMVCLPIQIKHTNKNLFDEEVISYHLSPLFRDTVDSLGKIELGQVGHRYMKILLPEGIKLDLFTPSKEDFFRQLAIRTGSSVYSRHFIAAAWSREGWCGTDDGLRKRHECKQVGTNNWKCIKASPTLPPMWQSEQEFFNWLNLSYLPPELRDM